MVGIEREYTGWKSLTLVTSQFVWLVKGTDLGTDFGTDFADPIGFFHIWYESH